MSGSIRLFVPAPLHAGAVVSGSAAQAHYLGGVMRRRAGDAVRLFNGADGEWLAHIAELRRDRLRLDVAEPLRPPDTPDGPWLVFAVLKREATELVVQKATELGVAALLPVITDRSQPARLNLERLAAIATEAAEQSERLSVPRIDPPVPLAALLAGWPPARRLVVAMERVRAAPVRPGGGPAALMIGPEGGFSPAELDVLGRHPLVEPASLGPLILRAETAAIAGLALLRAGPAADRCGHA